MKNQIKIAIYQLFFGAKKIGVDEFFNQYFITKNNRRIVIYNGIEEPTKIPMNWHLWIHYITNDIPNELSSSHKKYSWQKIHIPNLTGTKNSYSPSNSENSKTNQIYQSWQPK